MSRSIKPEIEALANHAANMVNIMECYEDLGRPKPRMITDELERVLTCLNEELENEARSSKLPPDGGEKDGTSPAQSEPVRSSPVGGSGVGESGKVIRR